jgi:hypothetical protein
MSKIVSTIGGHAIEESCGHFYPVFNGNVEFKTLRECQAFILFWHMPMLRLFAAFEKNCTPMIVAMCNTPPHKL